MIISKVLEDTTRLALIFSGKTEEDCRDKKYFEQHLEMIVYLTSIFMFMCTFRIMNNNNENRMCTTK